MVPLRASQKQRQCRKRSVQRRPVRHSCEGERESLLSKGRTQTQWKRATGAIGLLHRSVSYCRHDRSFVRYAPPLPRTPGQGEFYLRTGGSLGRGSRRSKPRRSCNKIRFGGSTDRNRRIETELKTELAGVGTKIAELRTELKSEIVGARGELKS